jgi:hypothetical protein
MLAAGKRCGPCSACNYSLQSVRLRPGEINPTQRRGIRNRRGDRSAPKRFRQRRLAPGRGALFERRTDGREIGKTSLT